MAKYYEKIRRAGLDCLRSEFGDEAVERAIENTAAFEVEVPGWQFWAGFGGGGRFDSGNSGGAARNNAEIVEDAEIVHKLTGSTPEVGVHVLWFFSRDGATVELELAAEMQKELDSRGLRMGSISPTYFLEGSRDGSFSAADQSTRARYIEQTVAAATIAAENAGGLLTLWFPDGTNYPGQRQLQDKIGLLGRSLSEFWEKTPEYVRNKLSSVLVEYKLFEPGTYSTTVSDWGTARELSRIFGHRGGVLVDLGHHPHGANVEQIVANLLWIGARCGMHFNTRYAADDDHSVQADYPLARLFYELLRGGALFNSDSSRNWAMALDQMARTEQRIPSVLKSVDALKRAVASASLALSLDLEPYQQDEDLIGANAEFERALLHADTGALVMESYVRRGVHPVPLDAYRESGYQQRIEQERS